MTKVVLIVCDALRDDMAAQHMGYLEHLVEEDLATRYTVQAALPTISRPLYETIQTGTHPHQHGITSNIVNRQSTMPNLFQLAREHNKTTAAAAYHWISELYIRTPYNLIQDREIDDDSLTIQHGRFYQEDDFPDIELFAAGGTLLLRHQPDYMLIHPMGLDYIGHRHGGESKEYQEQVMLQDQILANLLPMLTDYTVLVTGDHGMNAAGQHNGTDDSVRLVPLYLITDQAEGNTGKTVSQLRIAPTICDLLDIPQPETMQHASLLRE